jgi:hypothetical protein
LSLFPSNHRWHAQKVNFNMKFDKFFMAYLQKEISLVTTEVGILYGLWFLTGSHQSPKICLFKKKVPIDGLAPKYSSLTRYMTWVNSSQTKSIFIWASPKAIFIAIHIFCMGISEYFAKLRTEFRSIMALFFAICLDTSDPWRPKRRYFFWGKMVVTWTKVVSYRMRSASVYAHLSICSVTRFKTVKNQPTKFFFSPMLLFRYIDWLNSSIDLAHSQHWFSTHSIEWLWTSSTEIYSVWFWEDSGI